MANDTKRGIKVYLDTTDYSKGISELNNKTKEYTDRLTKLEQAGKGNTAEAKRLAAQLEKNKVLEEKYNAQLEDTKRILNNLSGTSYNQLLAVRARIQKQLREAVPGTKAHTAALEQNRRVTEALTNAQRAMRVEVGSQSTMWNRAINGFNKYAAIATAGIAAITGAVLSLNNFRNKRDAREEAKADVEALTGLSQDSIDWLEDQAKEMSVTMDEAGIRIRKSATEILEAYKLVGSAKPELLQDKEALNDVTKQALILAEAAKLDMKTAVDAVTLSLNQYSAGADQAARYTNVYAAGSKVGAAAVNSITTAVVKSGVSAAAANVPIEQLVGTIETLAEKGIKDEVAGTGLKKFFLTLQTGADDTNPAVVGLTAALENLQRKQLSAAEIKKMFGQEGYNVAQILINEADKVDYYTKAVTGTNIAMEQAAIQSDTAAAKFAQAKNRMAEYGITLMEQLNPGLVSFANKLVNCTGLLITMVSFFVQYNSVILTTIAIIGSYLVAKKLLVLWESKYREAKLLTLAIEKLQYAQVVLSIAKDYALAAAKAALTLNVKALNIAMRGLWITLGLNPIAATIGLIAGLGLAIYKFCTRTKEATSYTESFYSAVSEECEELNKMHRQLIKANDKTDERTRLINEFNSKFGKYIGNLLDEKSTIEDIKKAYEEATVAMNDHYARELYSSKHSEIMKEGIEKQSKVLKNSVETAINATKEQKARLSQLINDVTNQVLTENPDFGIGNVRNKIYEEINRAFGSGSSYDLFGGSSGWEKFSKEIYPFIERVKDSTVQVKALKEELSPFMKEGTPATSTSSTPPSGVCAVCGQKPCVCNSNIAVVEDKKTKELLEAEKTRYEQRQALLKELYVEGNDETLQTEKQYQEELECLKVEYLKRALSLTSEGSKEQADILNQLNDVYIKNRTSQIQQSIDAEKALYEQHQNELKNLYISGDDENLRDEQQYNEAMEQLTLLHLQRMLEIANLNAEQRKAVERQLLDFKVKCIQDEEKERKRAADEAQKLQDKNAQADKARLDAQTRQYRQYGEQIGDVMGQVISGQEDALKSFADTMLDVLFDVLGQLINIEITKAAATATGAVARATAESMATPDSVLSFGASGAARAAVMTGLIMGALATAKSALKGMIKGKSSSSSSSSSTDSEVAKSATVKVSQWARGNYSVIGEDDGKQYNDIPYIGSPASGIVRRTSLISENGSELIVNAEDLARLKNHINYPLVLSAINDARSGVVAQRASGNYQPISPAGITGNTELFGLIEQLKSLVGTLKKLKAYVVLRDIEEAQELDKKSKEAFTKKSK